MNTRHRPADGGARTHKLVLSRKYDGARPRTGTRGYNSRHYRTPNGGPHPRRAGPRHDPWRVDDLDWSAQACSSRGRGGGGLVTMVAIPIAIAPRSLRTRLGVRDLARRSDLGFVLLAVILGTLHALAGARSRTGERLEQPDCRGMPTPGHAAERCATPSTGCNHRAPGRDGAQMGRCDPSDPAAGPGDRRLSRLQEINDGARSRGGRSRDAPRGGRQSRAIFRRWTGRSGRRRRVRDHPGRHGRGDRQGDDQGLLAALPRTVRTKATDPNAV